MVIVILVISHIPCPVHVFSADLASVTRAATGSCNGKTRSCQLCVRYLHVCLCHSLAPPLTAGEGSNPYRSHLDPRCRRLRAGAPGLTDECKRVCKLACKLCITTCSSVSRYIVNHTSIHLSQRIMSWYVLSSSPELPLTTANRGGLKKAASRAGTQLMQKTGQIERTVDREFMEEEARYRT